MKTRTKIAGGAALAALVSVGAAVWCCWPGKEPVYKGKGAREYLWDVTNWSDDPRHKEACAAFKFFGTNSVPSVRTALRARNTWDRRALAWAADKVPWLKIRVRTATEERFEALGAYARIINEGWWGDAKAICAPEVRDLAHDPNPEVRRVAMLVLGQTSGFQYDLR